MSAEFWICISIHLQINLQTGMYAGYVLACSRLSVVGDERKQARKKRGRTKARRTPFLPHLSPPSFFLSLSLFFAPNYRETGTG